MYYRICSSCGDHLDPGERCECVQNSNDKYDLLKKLIKTDRDGQFAINIRQISEEEYVT